jgi:arabinose-5-phosphate isomerase
MNTNIQSLLDAEARAVQNVPLSNPFTQVLSVIHKSQKRHGKLVVTGVGKAGDVGRKIVSTFNSAGISSVFLSPLDARHGDLGMIGPRDVLFLISNSGKTNEITELIFLTRALHTKIPIICLTGNEKSPLASSADYVLWTGNPKEICPLNLTPTSSVLAMLAIADVLTVLSIESRKYTAAEYKKRHHSGYLGTRAAKKTKREQLKK